jgi:hypothetical protein
MNPNASEPSADLALSTERMIRGIVTDPDGKPSPGVSIVVRSVGRPTNLGGYDGVNLGIVTEDASPGAWPKRATTDAEGRFTIRGTGPTANVRLHGIDGRSPMAYGVVDAKEGASEAEVSLRFHKTAVVDGRVLAADTGLGLSRATIEVSSIRTVPIGGYTRRASIGNVRVESDNQGAFRATVTVGSQYQIRAYPAADQPYFVTETDDLDAVGPEKGLTKELKLTRGVVIRGKVVESGTGKPLENATVQYLPARWTGPSVPGDDAAVASGKDGSYQIVVPRGKGRLFVHGPTSDYVIEEIGSNVVHKDQPGGTRLYAHKILAYDATEGDEPREINAELRRGKVVRGRVVGPGGAAVDKALIVALLQFNYFHLEWRGDLTQFARDGRFELHGLDPEKPTQVMFLDAEHQWGATVELSGRQEGEDVLVQLEPCGRAEARFLGPDGKPLHQCFPSFEILGAPGVDQGDDRPEAKTELSASGAWMTNVDRKNYWSKRSTGPDGRIAFPALIPGATYRIIDTSTMNDRDHGSAVRRDFAVKPGESLDLGEILIAKPPAP